MAKELGKIKFFNTEKRFGFIKPNENQEDIYFRVQDARFTAKSGDLVLFERDFQRGKPCAVSVRNLEGLEKRIVYHPYKKIIPKKGRLCYAHTWVGDDCISSKTVKISEEIERFFDKTRESIKERFEARKNASFIEDGGKSEYFCLSLENGAWKVYYKPEEKWFKPSEEAVVAKYAFLNGKVYKNLYRGDTVVVTDPEKKPVRLSENFGLDAEKVFDISIIETKEIFVENHTFVTESAVTNEDFADRGWRHATTYEKSVVIADATRVEKTFLFTPKVGYEYLGSHTRTSFYYKKNK